ncbi:MAG: hypothetical protein Aurels2KO_20000 [Aureliella sp.]
MAVVLPNFSSRRLSPRRGVAKRTEPAIGLRFLGLQNALEPNELLEFEYCVRRVTPEQVDRLELSVIWFTEGKGTEDIGVHLFQTLSSDDLCTHGCEEPRRISTLMPATPLSYEGQLFKIRWCVRIRLFLKNGREITTEQPFYLGNLTVEV